MKDLFFNKKICFMLSWQCTVEKKEAIKKNFNVQKSILPNVVIVECVFFSFLYNQRVLRTISTDSFKTEEKIYKIHYSTPTSLELNV